MSDLNQNDRKEKERILSSGFSNWSKEEFDKFCRSLLKFEKKDFKNI